MEALETTRSWKLAKLSKGKKAVGRKQVFTVKNKVDGSIKRYIARPAAKGFTQTLGLDHHGTFALVVAKLNSISPSILGRKQILAAF